MKNKNLFFLLIIFQLLFVSSVFSAGLEKQKKSLTFDYSIYGLMDSSDIYTPLLSISSLDAYYDENNPINRIYNFHSTPKLIDQYSLEYAILNKPKDIHYLLGLELEKWSFTSSDFYVSPQTSKKTIENSIFYSSNIKYFIGMRHFFKNSIFSHKYKYEVKNSESFLIDSIHISDEKTSLEFENRYLFVKPNFLAHLSYEYFLLDKMSLYAEYEFYISNLLSTLPIISNPEGFLVYRKNHLFSGIGKFSISHFEKKNFGLNYYFSDFLAAKIQFINEIVEYDFKKYQEYYSFSFSDFSFNRNSKEELLSDFLAYSQKFKKQTNRALVLGIKYNIGWE